MPNRFVTPYFSPLSSLGTTVPFAKLWFYLSGTTVPQDTYSDEALTNKNTNPVVADAGGRFPDIFLQSADYNVLLLDANDVQLWSADPVSGTLDTTGDDFKASEQNPVDMTVLVGVGSLFDIVNKLVVSLAAQTSALIVAPSVNPRNDLVCINRHTGVIEVATGVEATVPADPVVPDDTLPICRVELTVLTTTITNFIITDIRELNLLGSGDLTRYNANVIQNQTFIAFDDTGAADAYVITPDPLITAYSKYQTWCVDIANVNTGPATMNISAVGVRDIFDYRTGAALTGGEINVGINTFIDDDTRLMLMTPASAIKIDIVTASGSVTKPPGAKLCLVKLWGAGGSGGKGQSSIPAAGGGGGGYNEFLFDAADIGVTETVTIGAGGVAVTAANTSGNAGGDTSFGILLEAGGGGAGSFYSSTNGSGGGGGGGWLTGSNGTNQFGGDGGGLAGLSYGGLGKTTYDALLSDGGSAHWSGGGGGGSTNGTSQPSGNGGDSQRGGGGGGAAAETANQTYVGVGGAGVSGGGDGGDGGAANISNGIDGSTPGGGGGGCTYATTSGAGARGEARIYWY